MKTRMIAGTLVLFVACSPARDQVTASAQTSAQLPTATLDQLLAPIALYPDALLAQILMSAQDPPKVAELDKWLKSNATLKGTPLQDAAVKAGFDASFVALALFPQVVAKMAEQIAWTVVLGQSFTKDKTRGLCDHSEAQEAGPDRRDAEEQRAAGGRDQDDVER